MEIIDTVRALIEDEHKRMTEAVASGAAHDMKEYIRMTTRIRTLEDVAEMLTDVESRYIES